MVQLTERYTDGQAAVKNKLEKLQVELQMVSLIVKGIEPDLYLLSQQAAMEGMRFFAKKKEDKWHARKDIILKELPKLDFEKDFKINIFDKPTGKQISFDEFVGFDYQNQPVNILDYRGCHLAYALLEPPYNIGVEIDPKFGKEEYIVAKQKEFTTLYRMFLNDFILLSQYPKEDFIIYSWSDDWSNFFDEGKEYWGTYFWTVYNQQNNTIIVLGASATD